MKKNYIQPSFEVMTVHAMNGVCAVSSTETFGIISPNTPGNEIGAEEGR